MHYSHRHDRSGARPELKALVAGLNRQPTFDEVALILGMGMKRRRLVVWKQELDESKAPINYLPGDPDRRQRANDPPPLAVFLSQSHRSGSELRNMGAAPAVGFGVLDSMVGDPGPAGLA